MSNLPNNQVGELNVRITGDSRQLRGALKDGEQATAQATARIDSHTRRQRKAWDGVTQSVGKVGAAMGTLLRSVLIIGTVTAAVDETRAAWERLTVSGSKDAHDFVTNLTLTTQDADDRLKALQDRILEVQAQLAYNTEANFFEKLFSRRRKQIEEELSRLKSAARQAAGIVQRENNRMTELHRRMIAEMREGFEAINREFGQQAGSIAVSIERLNSIMNSRRAAGR